MRKFRASLLSNSTLKKKKEYDFEDIPEHIFTKAKKHTYKNPLFFKGKFCDYSLYYHSKELYVKMFLKFQTFREI